MFYLTVLLLLSCLLDSDVLFLEIKQFILADSRDVVVVTYRFLQKSGTDFHIIVFICALFVLSVFFIALMVFVPARFLAVLMAVGLGLFE